MPKRIDYLDTTKAFLIIFVVVGHIFLNGPIHNFIYTFHIPAFFIISGILFSIKETPFSVTIIKKIYSLIIPFIFFEIIGSIVYIIRYGFTQNIFGFIYNTITLHCNTGADWFLITLFFAELIFTALHKIIKSDLLKITLSIFLVLIALFLPNSYVFNIISKIFLATGFLSLGFYTANFFKQNNQPLLMFSFIVSLIVTALNGTVDLNEMILNNPFLYFIGSFSGTYFLIQISKKISFTPPKLFRQKQPYSYGNAPSNIITNQTFHQYN